MRDNVYYYDFNNKKMYRKRDASEIINDASLIYENSYLSFIDKFVISTSGFDRYQEEVLELEDGQYFTISELKVYDVPLDRLRLFLEYTNKRNISLGNIYTKAFYIALLSSDRLAMKIDNFIRDNGYFSYDGVKKMQIDLPDVYITDKFELISKHELNKDNSKYHFSSSLGELFQENDDKINVVSLKDFFIPAIEPTEARDLLGYLENKKPNNNQIESILENYDEVRYYLNNIFSYVYTHAIAGVLSKANKYLEKPETLLRPISISKDGKIKIDAYINWIFTYGKNEDKYSDSETDYEYIERDNHNHRR